MSKCGYVAILGRPNVGKSTLLNALVGQPLAIITPKPQTTRNRIFGVSTTDEIQAIFLDTPGMLNPKYRLQELMVKQIDKAIGDADVLIFMVDSTDFVNSFDRILQSKFTKAWKPAVLALNKIDQVKGKPVLEAMERLSEFQQAAEIVPISALRGDGLDQLRDLIGKLLPEGPFLYPLDVIATQPERFFVAELIREELVNLLRQELPYATAVKVEEFREKEGGKTYIRAIIFVEKLSQKGIIIGTSGEVLKRIGTTSRQKIELFLG
ncbi:MAG: GTPase Era, partial [Candidatus Latescibacteria bacterium]|nr:GTPase Era [Candidatus Latescibacterota bacterium]